MNHFWGILGGIHGFIEGGEAYQTSGALSSGPGIGLKTNERERWLTRTDSFTPFGLHAFIINTQADLGL